jgi:hypothetical protein
MTFSAKLIFTFDFRTGIFFVNFVGGTSTDPSYLRQPASVRPSCCATIFGLELFMLNNRLLGVSFSDKP